MFMKIIFKKIILIILIFSNNILSMKHSIRSILEDLTENDINRLEQRIKIDDKGSFDVPRYILIKILGFKNKIDFNYENLEKNYNYLIQKYKNNTLYNNILTCAYNAIKNNLGPDENFFGFTLEFNYIVKCFKNNKLSINDQNNFVCPGVLKLALGVIEQDSENYNTFLEILADSYFKAKYMNEPNNLNSLNLISYTQDFVDNANKNSIDYKKILEDLVKELNTLNNYKDNLDKKNKLIFLNINFINDIISFFYEFNNIKNIANNKKNIINRNIISAFEILKQLYFYILIFDYNNKNNLKTLIANSISNLDHLIFYLNPKIKDLNNINRINYNKKLSQYLWLYINKFLPYFMFIYNNKDYNKDQKLFNYFFNINTFSEKSFNTFELTKIFVNFSEILRKLYLRRLIN